MKRRVELNDDDDDDGVLTNALLPDNDTVEIDDEEIENPDTFVVAARTKKAVLSIMMEM
jgi:hypothetical protein